MSNGTRTPQRRRASPRTQQRSGATRDRRPIFLGLAAVAVVAVVAIAWIATRGGSSTNSTGASTGVAHVHGLGIDPADGALYVATHFGVFRIPDDAPAEQVGPAQDTMGFTVVGPEHFLGSGHPGAEGQQQGQPPLLGLIESADGAVTWQDVSLSGEVDFHALAYTHDLVYGWDSISGQLMVSADKRTWDTRSTLQLFAFAVDPSDRDQILATTPEGMQTSSDGGRSWQPLTEAPELVLVVWDPDSGLWGADPGGAVHHTTGLDVDWRLAGALPGPPQAFLADGETLYAAAEDDEVTGIYRSSDGGATWEIRYRDDEP